MTDGTLPIADLSAVLKASLPVSAGGAVDRLLLLLSEFTAVSTDQQIRILSDRRLGAGFGADLLLQIDDYDLRLELLDPGPSGRPALNLTRLVQIITLLEDNPNTAALVLVWATDDLLAVHLSMARARAVASNPAVLATLLSKARPFPEVLRALVLRQLPTWDASLAAVAPGAKGQALDTRRVFEQAIVQAIEAERHRTYRTPTRKQAALQFPVEEETRIILDALEKALAGAPAAALIPDLIRLSRRGSR